MLYEPPTDATWTLHDRILVGFYFRPVSQGSLNAEELAQHYPATPVELEAVVDRLMSEGFVERYALGGGFVGFGATAAGWKARERMLLERGLRHPVLAGQSRYEPQDLVVALAMAPSIHNAKRTGMLGEEESISFDELFIYLHEYAEDHVRDVVNKLLADSRGLVKSCFKRDRELKERAALALTKLGQDYYRTHVVPTLGLTTDVSVLEFDARAYIEIFLAWQSEFGRSRSKIDEALEKAVKAINDRGSTVRPLVVTQATQPGDGALRIDVALQERIKAADFFVGDLTPVYAYKGRLRVNENVLVEIGFALASKKPNEVILLAMRRTDVPGEPGEAKPAFDIAHVRRLEFTEPAELRRKLQTELETALQERGFMR